MIYDAYYQGDDLQLPSWVGILAAAEAWGIPPQEVEKSSAFWFLRWTLWHNKRLAAENDRQQQNVRRAKRK